MESTPILWPGHQSESAVTKVMESYRKLDHILQRYQGAATSLYRDDPESLSAMNLTMMELWITLDISAATLVPLLHEYAPGFPAGVFDGLVLHKREQLERLARVEDYLARRRAGAGSNGPPWQFGSGDGTWSETCFAARYYDASPQHQQLHQNILRRAEAAYAEDQKRAASAVEAARLAEQKYNELAKQAVGAAEPSKASPAAARDTANVRAAAGNGLSQTEEIARNAEYAMWAAKAKVTEMYSTFFLWPLPRNLVAAKAVVFELKAPSVVVAWRNTTLGVLTRFRDILPKSPHPKYYPGDHPLVVHSLWSHREGGGPGRFHLAVEFDTSTGKLLYESSTSRSAEPFPLKHIFDGCIFSDMSPSSSTAQHYYYPPSGHSPILRRWILGTAHTANDVLAAQPLCPENMTLDEFRAFGGLRAGSQLQWHNILLQLTIPSLDLNRPEAFFLVMQAANEAGPRAEGQNNALRSTHAILGEQRFGDSLLAALEDALGRVARTWESEVSLCILVSLAVRLLSVSPHRPVQDRCLAYLQRLRHETAGRARRLDAQLRSCGAAEEERRSSLARHAHMMALLCHATFDVGTAHAPFVLSENGESALLLEASIRAAEHMQPRMADHPTTPILDVFLHRWRRLSYETELLLKDLIVAQGSPCLDMAAGAVWDSYARGAEWLPAPAPRQHVLVASMPAAPTEKDALSLRYDLLTGCFMVGGSPFAALPESFRWDWTYKRLFGHAVFTVVPSYLRSQGMQYLATSRYHGHELHFAMLGVHSTTLVVRSVKDSVGYELIPPGLFDFKNIPRRWMTGYTHWLVVGQRRIEFRPHPAAWQTLQDVGPSPAEHYYVLDDFSSGPATTARLTRAGSAISVVDIHSNTARIMHTIFGPLERSESIELAFDQDLAVLQINLPMLRLSFRLTARGSTIASDQYRGYAVDENQSLGTLSGLSRKLVLRRSAYGETTLGRQDVGLDARLALIPDGEVSFTTGSDGRAQSTRIARGAEEHHTFHVDTLLGCLRDGGGGAIRSKLFLCYLHAITTHCLPDKLTGRTGTEEALRILRSAAVRSAADQLQPSDINLLRRIGSMSPIRHMGSHQAKWEVVEWPSTAPRVACDDSFCELVEHLFRRAKLLGPRSLMKDVDVKLPHRDKLLVSRAAARASAYRIPQYSQPVEPPKITTLDIEYSPDNNARLQGGGRYDGELEACHLAKQLIQGEDPTVCVSSLRDPFVRCPDSEPVLGAEFRAGWIRNPQDIPIAVWTTAVQEIDSMRRSKASHHHEHPYKLILFLAGLLFAPGAKLELVQLLLAIAKAPIKGYSWWSEWEWEMNLVRILGVASRTTDNRFTRGSSRNMVRYFKPLVARPPVSPDPLQPSQVTRPFLKERSGPRRFVVSVEDMFRLQPAPPAHRSARGTLGCGGCPDVPETQGEQQQQLLQPHKLGRLLGELRAMAHLQHQQRYVKELEESASALQKKQECRRSDALPANQDTRRQLLLAHLEACRREVSDAFAAISKALTDTPIATACGGGGGGSSHKAHLPTRLPPITPMLLLERLSWRHRHKLSRPWLQCLVDYADALTALQRAERMARVADDPRALARELQNAGHENWDPVEFPDWLLLEVEMGILIRPAQRLVASAMIAPPGAHNHVMQLNMGEGKSSVVVPMVAAELSDGSQLVRVIVTKSQSKQMVHTLARALSGLLDRCVYQLPPFSRSLGNDSEQSTSYLARLHALCVECLEDGGVVLVQPEHLLSLRLSVLENRLLGAADDSETPPKVLPFVCESLTDILRSVFWRPPLETKEEDAKPVAALLQLRSLPQFPSLLQLQHFLDKNSRDVMDESDEILSTRSELTYTMGGRAAIDLGPLRWRMIRNVLVLVAEIIAPAMAQSQTPPDWLEFVPPQRAGQFPRIRILHEAGAAALTGRLARRILDGGLTGLTYVAGRPQPVKEAVLRYLVQLEPAAGDMAAVEAAFVAPEQQWPLFLLRGLLAHGVLCFALQKRWRVDYGRTDNRDPPTRLAVPFRAKDLPAARSEFSHPDTVIILTCLSYYYEGLHDDEIERLVGRLLVTVDGEREYQAWVESAPNEFPPALRQLGAINLRDRQHCTANVLPRLRYLRMAVDYYLLNMVFAHEMCEYPQKLSESGWSLAAARAHHPTTGFSGTNDTKYLLPLSIQSLHLEEQRHTNALVLSHILRPENKVQDMLTTTTKTTTTPALQGPPGGQRHSLPSLQLLGQVVNSAATPIRVIIDAGAQIVDLANAELARRWLALVPAADASAAVFFDSDEEMCVVTRDGKIEPFLTSSYATNTASCLVYLDEAHARGTDLRLPSDYRAAVTLGPALTKDRLVQGDT